MISYIYIIKLFLATASAYWDQVLFHKWSQHVVSDGGHDVAEVQGGDGATFVLVFLCKCLAGMLKLQLLQTHTRTHTGGQAWSWKASKRICSNDEQHDITGEQKGKTLGDESIIISVLDRCVGQMWQCQILALVITTDPVGTNGNHVARSLIPEMSRAPGEDGRQVCRQEGDSVWHCCNQTGVRGEADPMSVPPVRAHRGLTRRSQTDVKAMFSCDLVFTLCF